MTKRLVSAAVAVALLAGGIVLGSLTSASSQGGGGTTRFTVFNPDARTVDQQVNVRPRDEILGDYFVGYGPLLSKPGGRQVGRIKFHCWDISESETGFTSLCDASFWIDGRGKISAHGSFTLTFPRGTTAVLPVTGGIGEFRNAGGTVKLNFRRGGISFAFTVS